MKSFLTILVVAVTTFALDATAAVTDLSEVLENVPERSDGRDLARGRADNLGLSKEAIAVIECSDKDASGRICGTGFVCTMDGERYFITGREVLCLPGRLTARFADAAELDISAVSEVELAENRDIVRIKFSTPRKGLECHQRCLDVKDCVELIGTRGRERMVDATRCRIVTIGVDRIEVECEVDEQNRGGPIMSADGKVVGVAVLHSVDPLDELAKVTIFAGQPNSKRDYGARLDGAKWIAVRRDELLRSVKALNDCETFSRLMLKLCFEHGQCKLHAEDLPKLRFRTVKMFNDAFSEIAKTDDAERKFIERIRASGEREQAKGSIARRGQMETDILNRRYAQACRDTFVVRRQVIQRSVNDVRTVKALAKVDRERYSRFLEELLKKYDNVFGEQLEGRKLPTKERLQE